MSEYDHGHSNGFDPDDEYINKDEDVFETSKAGAPDPEAVWDSDEALENLKMERSVTPDLSNEALMRKMFEEAGPMIAQSIIHVALHSSNDNTRLNAGKYVSDLLLGGDGANAEGWEKLLGEAISEVELHANASHGTDEGRG